jgi:hypothetical protein
MTTKSTHCEPESSAQSSFEETIVLDETIPCQKDIESVEDYALHNGTGRTTRFRDVFTGPTTPRRVLVIFVGHFLNPVSRWPDPCLSKGAVSTRIAEYTV